MALPLCFFRFAHAQSTPPSLTSVNPASGAVSGGTTVTLTGTNFQSGATVLFGDTSAENVVFVSGTKLTAVTPAHASGAVNVTVTNPDTQNSSLANGFIFGGALTISSVKSARSSTNGGAVVTISGSNFTTETTVTIGGNAASHVTFISSTQLICTTPAHAGGGAVDVTVTNPGAPAAVLPNGMTYIQAFAPTVDRVTPDFGTNNGGTTVSVVGTRFVPGSSVVFGGVVLSTTYEGTKRLMCVTPAAPLNAVVTVEVINPDGQRGALPRAFDFNVIAAPGITSIAPNHGPTNGGNVARIKGSNFIKGATVTFDGTAASNVAFVTSRFMTCTVPARISGAGTSLVVVTNPDGTRSVLSRGYTYTLAHTPLLAGVTPDTGPDAGGTTVIIAGSGFVNGTAVDFGGVAAQSVTFNSPTQLTCVTPTNSAGGVLVTVTNPDGQSRSLVRGFTYIASTTPPPPTLVSLAPSTGNPLGGTFVTVTGRNFVSGARVTFGGVAATVIFVSATQLTTSSPPHAIGAVDMVVTNPDLQTSTLSAGFIYEAP